MKQISIFLCGIMLCAAMGIANAQTGGDGIKLNQEHLTLSLGEEFQLMVMDAQGSPVDAIVSWSSSNDAIATVTADGLVKGATMVMQPFLHL